MKCSCGGEFRCERCGGKARRIQGLHNMTPKLQIVFACHFVLGMTNGEIADALQIKKHAVEQRIHRAKLVLA